MDTLTAARAQMEVSLAFHMVFAALGIGLPLLMAIAEGLWLRTGKQVYRDPMCKYFLKEKVQVRGVRDSGEFLAPEEAPDGPGYLDYHLVLLA
jgi:bd-type cytochrome oxidase subunit I